MSLYLQALSEHEVEIPETINTQTLVKDLAKEIRLVEVSSRISRKFVDVFNTVNMCKYKYCYDY